MRTSVTTKTLLSILLCFISAVQISVWAQTQQFHRCATWEVFVRDSANVYKFENLEVAVGRYLEMKKMARHEDRTIYRIPVVFHVVLTATQHQQVSDAQIYAQLDSLNAAFRGRMANTGNTPTPFLPLNGDARIEFVLAKEDPNGNPTTGINRVTTGANCLDPTNNWQERSSASGGANPWDPNRYLNIWIINPCGGLLGIATFPGSNDPQGVTIAYHSLPGGNAPFDRGKTLVHEMGHFFGLRHIWGDAWTGTTYACFDDKVGDTPPQAGPTSRCPTYPQAQCGTDSKMFVNHMDYSDDDCLTMFTKGQVERMRAFLLLSSDRTPLIYSDVASNVANDLAFGKPVYPPAHTYDYKFIPQVEIVNVGNNPITSATINTYLNGTLVGTTTWTGNLNSGSKTTVSLPQIIETNPGRHQLRAVITSINGGTDGYNANDTLDLWFTVPQFCGFSSDFETDPVPDIVWTEINPDLEIGANAGTVSSQNNARTWYWNIKDFTKGSNGASTFTAYVETYYYNSTPQYDSLESPYIDLRNATGAVNLTFDVAYAQYNNTTNDGLKVLVSADSGQTWTVVYNKAGNTLATVAPQTGYFIPQNNTDWRTETVDLSTYAGKMIILRFVSINDYGNNLYIDNVSVTTSNCTGTPLSNKFAILTGKYQSGTIVLKWMMQDDPSVDSIAIFKRISDKWELVCSQVFEPTGTCQDAFEQSNKTPHKIHYRLFYKSNTHPNWKLGGATFVSIDNDHYNPFTTTSLSAIYNPLTKSLAINGLPEPHVKAVIITDLSGKQMFQITNLSLLSEKVIINGIEIPQGLYVVEVQLFSEHLLSALLVVPQ
ncbi:MAG: hypothetical protein GXO48_04590 [Chlorobi bacterium]|nr:hypothetical protein [Chlorobiota bacterium]